jgi:two-component system KDP operon response regulator KdpE
VTETIILLIDDDDTLTSLLGEHLTNAGYAVRIANDGKSGLRFASELAPALIILDVMMPGMDGWQVLAQLSLPSKCSVIMLTAKDQEFDKLRAFKHGVDDYVTKPFSFAEITARVGAVLGRAAHGQGNHSIIITGELQINLQKRRVKRGTEAIDLTPTEYRLLERLARNIDVPVPSEALVNHVWGPTYAGEVEHVKHYIWSLRRKLEKDPGDPEHILTERGFGYRLV